jgi:hypothetical protein
VAYLTYACSPDAVLDIVDAISLAGASDRMQWRALRSGTSAAVRGCHGAQQAAVQRGRGAAGLHVVGRNTNTQLPCLAHPALSAGGERGGSHRQQDTTAPGG